MPAVSIVVPTRDRPDAVARLARSLASQDPVEGGVELIVVADGCSDAALRRLHATALPAGARILEQLASGAAMARNCGAALAESDLLLFLDDDVEPQPGMLRAHVAQHASRARTIAIGYLPPIVTNDFFGSALRGWWESMFDGLRQPGHRYTWRDLLTGHLSIRRADFEAIGGFTPSLRCHEDWEFGYRAIRAGLDLVFLPQAAAWHHEDSDVEKSLRRKFEEGRADVQLVAKYPELAPSLPVAWEAPGIPRLGRLAWDHPHIGDRLMSVLQRLLRPYERWRLRFRWRAALERLMVYWYWRGVSHEAGTRARLDALLASAAAVPASEPLLIDLSPGLSQAARSVDAAQPRSVRLVYGSDLVGDVPDVPGAERLRGVHLTAALARPLSRPYAAALARHGVLPSVFASVKIAIVPQPAGTMGMGDGARE